MLRGLEQTPKPAMAPHVHRNARLGPHGNFVVIFFVVVWRGRLAVGRLEVVDEAVDLVEQALPLYFATTVS
jgi:hypothetical protein